jgi:hypothetical protein
MAIGLFGVVKISAGAGNAANLAGQTSLTADEFPAIVRKNYGAGLASLKFK